MNAMSETMPVETARSLSSEAMALATFFARASVEITPKTLKGLLSAAQPLPAGSAVFIAFMPDQDIEEMATVAAKVRAAGWLPIAHIPARSMTSVAMLNRYLDVLAANDAIEELLLVGGGTDSARGPFDSVMAMLDSGAFEGRAIRRLHFAGHPEGHPNVSEQVMIAALQAKLAWAEARGIDGAIATQFCLEGAPIFAWERKLRAAGITAQVRVGLPGPATLKSLLMFAGLCGVGNSMRVLKRQALNIAKLTRVNIADKLIVELANHGVQHEDSLLAAPHMYPFGGVARTLALTGMLRDGGFHLDGKGGFSLARDLEAS